MAERRSFSTAISDAVLAATCLGSASVLYSIDKPVEALAIFGLIGFAACLGVLRFGLSPSIFGSIHTLTSGAAKYISAPLIGVTLAAHYAPADIRTYLGVHEEMVVFTSFLVFLATWVVVGVAFPVRGSDMLFGLIGSIVGLGATLRAYEQAPLALFGAVGLGIYIVAGIVFGMHGWLLGVKRVDLLHYFLAIANLSLLFSLAANAPVAWE